MSAHIISPKKLSPPPAKVRKRRGKRSARLFFMSRDREDSSYEQRPRNEVVAELQDIYNHFFQHEYFVSNYIVDWSRKRIVSSTMRAMAVRSVSCELAKAGAKAYSSRLFEEGDADGSNQMYMASGTYCPCRNVDWLMQVHELYCMLPDSLYLGVRIMDRYLSAHSVPARKIQLIAAASLLLADKYHTQDNAITLAEVARLCDDEYSHKQVADAEIKIFLEMDGYLSFPTSYTIMQCFWALEPEHEFYRPHRDICTYCLDRTLFLPSCIDKAPSAVAAAALLLANHQWARDGMEYWPQEIASFSGYGREGLLNLANIILRGKIPKPSCYKLEALDDRYWELGHPHLLLPFISPGPTKSLDYLYEKRREEREREEEEEEKQLRKMPTPF